jgi:hypothetical protein
MGPGGPMTADAICVLAGDTWDWESEGTMNGQPWNSRYVIKQTSADTYTWRWELSVAGGPSTLMGEGTDTRVK